MTWGKSNVILSASQVIPIEVGMWYHMLMKAHWKYRVPREFYLKQLQRRAMRKRENLKRNQNFLGLSSL